VCLNNIARIAHSETQDGSWESLGGGCDDAVYDLQWWGKDLYLSGEFEKCGGTLVNHVTVYRDGEYDSLNNGVDDTVYSIEYLQGRLIAGGKFTHAGGLPVTGVASWDGKLWRALQSACTPECIPGDLNFYFNVPVTPNGAIHLHAARDNTALYARGNFGEGQNSVQYLAQWVYFDLSDNGRWTVKGDQLAFEAEDDDPTFKGDQIINNGTHLLVAATVSSDQWTQTGQSVHAYSLVQENWVDVNILLGSRVFVLRSSASTLSSPWSFLSSFFF